jgi:uncharacterized membrane protein YgcG
MAPEQVNSPVDYPPSRPGSKFVSALVGARLWGFAPVARYGAVVGAVVGVAAGGAWLQHHSAMTASSAQRGASRAAERQTSGRRVMPPLSGQPPAGSGINLGAPAVPLVAISTATVDGYSMAGSAPQSQVSGPIPSGNPGSVGPSIPVNPSASISSVGTANTTGGSEDAGTGESSGNGGAGRSSGNGGSGGSHGGAGGAGSFWARFWPEPGGFRP